jgi:hypothetical protein
MAGELMTQDLKPTYFIDSDSPAIGEFSRAATRKTKSDLAKAIKLYYAVRDGITYNPYSFSLDKDSFRASFILSKGNGWCVQKAILLAAVGRAAGIPTRLRFANVKNHLATERLKALMKTDLFVFHGLTEFYLEGRWVKATPAFNLSLCEKFGVLPLEFDGRNDSVFHPFDKNGRQHMEYTHDYGPFDDFPYELMMMEMRKYYPHFFSDDFSKLSVAADSFEAEAARTEKGTGAIHLKRIQKTADELQKIPGVGKSIAEDLRAIGIKKISDLRDGNPEVLYDALCGRMGKSVDRCVLYVFRCAVYFASNTKHDPEKLKWWNWKDEKGKG